MPVWLQLRAVVPDGHDAALSMTVSAPVVLLRQPLMVPLLLGISAEAAPAVKSITPKMAAPARPTIPSFVRPLRIPPEPPAMPPVVARVLHALRSCSKEKGERPRRHLVPQPGG